MLYLIKYLDGFVLGAAGGQPEEALEKAFAATLRGVADIDQVTERDSTEVVYDRTRGWLCARYGPRDSSHVISRDSGLVIGRHDEEPPAKVLDLDPPGNGECSGCRANRAAETTTEAPEPEATTETTGGVESSDSSDGA